MTPASMDCLNRIKRDGVDSEAQLEKLAFHLDLQQNLMESIMIDSGKSGPHCWGQGGSTQFAQQLETTVTAPPLVGCVVWSLTTFYSDGTTHTKQHRSKRVQPNGSPCANNHCSTRYEQSFRHNKHTHTNQKAATDKHSRHNH